VVIAHAGDSNDLDYLMELANPGARVQRERFLIMFATGRNVPKIQALFGCLPCLAGPAGVRHYGSVTSAGMWS
jgi:hypothetical protein